MEYKKLTVRPRSTHTLTNFGGLWHNEEAPAGGLGLTQKARHYWYDERNISSDGSPAMTVVRGSATAMLDGNDVSRPIVGLCGGDHPILLTYDGIMYCCGKSVQLDGLPTYEWSYKFHWQNEDEYILVSDTPVTLDDTITDNDGQTLGGLNSVKDTTWGVYFYPGEAGWEHPDQYVITLLCNGTDEQLLAYTYTQSTEIIDGDSHTVHTWELTGYNIKIKTVDWLPNVGSGHDAELMFDLTTGSSSGLTGVDCSIVRMGAWAVVWPLGIAVNAVKLANGDALTPGTDIIRINITNRYEDLSNTHDQSHRIRLYLYDLGEGKKIETTDVTISSSAPTGGAGKYWIDTSDDEAVLMRWSVETTVWVQIPQPYIQIYCRASDIVKDIEKGDAVQLSYLPSEAPGTTRTEEQQDVYDLLNASHLVMKKAGNNTFVIPGLVRFTNGSHAYYYLDQATGQTDHPYFKLERKAPDMDYVVSCGNRLWGCYYGTNDDGETLNEIYASALGDFRNWSKFQGLSTDSWTASRGTPAPFTGAAVLHNSPLFFREESLEKVYPSAKGAHQIQTFDLDGVEEGSGKSLCVVDDRLYYKSRLGIMVYTGTMPTMISQAFGDLRFKNGTGGRHGHKYLCSMEPRDGGDRVVACYDTTSGDWHLEENSWSGTAVSYKDELWYTDAVGGSLFKRYSFGGVNGFFAETGIIGYELPEHRFISCVRIRYRLQGRGSCTVKIKYDDALEWTTKATLGPTALETSEINIFPRRCDHFRLRFEGYVRPDGFKIVSISYRMERSEGGH